MIAYRVEAGEFARVFPKGASHVFNSVEFAELNRSKCDRVHYVLFKDGKTRGGIILGERNGELLSPFSAPFGGFCFTGVQLLEVVDGIVDALKQYAALLGMSVEISLTPEFYDRAMQPKVFSSLLRGGRLLFADINHYCPVEGYKGEEWRQCAEARMSGKVRQKFRRSFGEPFAMWRLSRNSPSDIERAYAVIAANRSAKGYPLRMTLDDVIRTAPLVDAEFFVMTHGEDDVAAAVVYRVAPEIMQVVYWGDAPGFEQLYPMRRFAPEVMHACAEMGARILDIGPSSEYGIPSHGLCFFKDSVGCLSTIKPRFRLS
ncbi:MAG: hypothetical protein HDS68_06895 [Bacteroidales bacterium]|nr:hypothetical protein [Bacteroidales bacterium]